VVPNALRSVTFIDLVSRDARAWSRPIVVPELATITIGGAVSGCSIESMSFVRGGFHDTCLGYEVITARGEVLRCTPHDEHRLVFEMMHGSFGTLGILSKLTFKLVPAKAFVHLAYERYETLADYQAAIRRRFQARDVDFMDGIIHSPRCFVLSLGRFVDTAPYVHRYDWMKVYFRSTAKRREDYLRTIDYYFRYDRGVTNVRPKSAIGRALFGKLMTSTRWLQLADKLHWLLKSSHPTITVDVFVPFSKTPAFMNWYQREIDFFPVWVVPYRRVKDYPRLANNFWSTLNDEPFLDLAIYGMRQHGRRNIHREIELKLRELGGIKTLISHNYYSISRGDIAYGAFCLVALALTLIPAIRARRIDAGVPLELELVLLWFMVTDMTLGNLLGLYQLPYYDKALHLGSSILVAMIGFLAIYVLHLTHQTRFHPWLDALAILLVTLGIGALWEVAEYGVDQLFTRRTQGAPNQSAIDDTMFDLMMDGVGGMIGAVLGPLYIRYSRRSRVVVDAFAEFIEGRSVDNRLPGDPTRP
jgi:hypothetical protein